MPSEALDYITIEGYRSIRSITKLALSPINVLIGANGSGKSNFIGAFSLLHEIREGRLQDYLRRSGGAEQVLHFGSKTTQRIHFHVSFRKEVNQYELVLEPTTDDGLFVSDEGVYFWGNKSRYNSPYAEGLQPLNGGREAGISNPKVTRTSSWVRHRLGLFRVYHVHDTSNSSPMRKTAQIEDREFLRPDGSNLAAFLYFLGQKHPDEYDLIRRTIQRVTPFFDDFVLRPDALNEETIRLAWKHKQSDQYFAAGTLSDGTLRFIVLATLFLQPSRYRPSVIVVDEPELGLHPYAITMLAALVKQVSVETQVILSTQSALLLDQFRPEDVLVASRVENSTALNRLDSALLDEWLQEYSLGQLWEKNEFGGRPR